MTDQKKNSSLTQLIEAESELEISSVIPDAAGNVVTHVQKKKLRQRSYVLDLRIQSPASLGYHGIEGIDPAPALVRLAKVKGIDIIGITDFYDTKFLEKVRNAAVGSAVTVIPGVAIRCKVGACDDISMLALFSEVTPVEKIQEMLAVLEVPVSASGNHSYVVNRTIDQILETFEQFGALALPSRVDKSPHRLYELPKLVEQYGFRAFDLAYHDSTAIFKRQWPKRKFSLWSFSNANALAQVGSRVAKVKLDEPNFEMIRVLLERDFAEPPQKTRRVAASSKRA